MFQIPTARIFVITFDAYSCDLILNKLIQCTVFPYILSLWRSAEKNKNTKSSGDEGVKTPEFFNASNTGITIHLLIQYPGVHTLEYSNKLVLKTSAWSGRMVQGAETYQDWKITATKHKCRVGFRWLFGVFFAAAPLRTRSNQHKMRSKKYS